MISARLPATLIVLLSTLSPFYAHATVPHASISKRYAGVLSAVDARGPHLGSGAGGSSTGLQRRQPELPAECRPSCQALADTRDCTVARCCTNQFVGAVMGGCFACIVKGGGYPHDRAQEEIDAFIKNCGASGVQLTPVHLPPLDPSATTPVIGVPGTGVLAPQNTTSSRASAPVTVTTSVFITPTTSIAQMTITSITSQPALVQATVRSTASETSAATTTAEGEPLTPTPGSNSTEGGSGNILNGNNALGISAPSLLTMVGLISTIYFQNIGIM